MVSAACSQKKIVKVKDPFKYTDFEKKHKKTIGKSFVSFYQDPVAPEIKTDLTLKDVLPQANLLDAISRPYRSAIVVLAEVDAKGNVKKTQIITGGSEADNKRIIKLTQKIKFKPAFLGGNSYPSKVYIRFLR